MRKILIPTDFSENAMNAIRYTMELFKYDRSEFIVMHTYADEVYEYTKELSRDLFEKYKEKVMQRTDKALKKIVAKMLERSPNPRHKYEYRSVFGSLVDVANDLADKENIGIIVMGTKGKTDDRDITFGSQTLQVIKYVKCPVLAVPQGYENEKIDNILFPTDYFIPYKRRELKLVSTIARNFGAQLNFLHISKSEKLFHRQMDNKNFLDYCMEQNQCVHTNIIGDDLTSTINNHIEEFSIDILVMVNSRHSYMESLLNRSTIEKIGLHVKIPFLILQNLPR